MDSAAVQHFVQRPDRGDAPESATQHENALACFAPHSSNQ
jgi:hypothetical protein